MGAGRSLLRFGCGAVVDAFARGAVGAAGRCCEMWMRGSLVRGSLMGGEEGGKRV